MTEGHRGGPDGVQPLVLGLICRKEVEGRELSRHRGEAACVSEWAAAQNKSKSTGVIVGDHWAQFFCLNIGPSTWG